MKPLKLLALSLTIAALLSVIPAQAVKPTQNLASAQKVPWNLSAAVMPVPPYGSRDIVGSDTASKLIVNQPNGNTEVTITGAMNGLHPNTEYTVYLSNSYVKYTPTNILGIYKWLVLSTYEHDLVITQQNPDGTFSGTGGYPAGQSPYMDPGETPETITGQITGDQISLTTTYQNWVYSVTAIGTIALDGSMSGTSPWEWHTTEGHVTLASGSTGWPGLFTSTIPQFTFTTDGSGAGSWHLNLRDSNFPGAGKYSMSVWINEAGATILVSDSFDVVVG